MEKDHLVVAISSVSGGGKTTVVRKLLELLDDASAIYFDDYETPETYPKNPAALIESGADFNEVKSPLLAEHLRVLKAGEKVSSPKKGEVILPARIILFEAPLGRAQRETGQYIDYLVFIDTPLEVGLARRLRRTVANLDMENMSREDLVRHLKSTARLADDYLLWMRKAYLVQRELVKPESDLVLDGELPVDELAKAIQQALTEAKLV